MQEDSWEPVAVCGRDEMCNYPKQPDKVLQVHERWKEMSQERGQAKRRGVVIVACKIQGWSSLVKSCNDILFFSLYVSEFNTLLLRARVEAFLIQSGNTVLW